MPARYVVQRRDDNFPGGWRKTGYEPAEKNDLSALRWLAREVSRRLGCDTRVIAIGAKRATYIARALRRRAG